MFYVDNIATWASDYGGVSRVKSYMLMGNEIEENFKGPIDLENATESFKSTMEVDYVKVYQNTKFIEHIRTPESFA